MASGAWTGLTAEQIAKMIREAAVFGQSHGFFKEGAFEHLTREQVYKPGPVLHGAIDYRKRPDGVWEMPR